MFEVFNFIFNCIASICNLLDKFVLWQGFTYLDFCTALVIIPCLFKVIHIIRTNIDDEDEYEPKHAKR